MKVWAALMWVGMTFDAHADIEYVACDAAHGAVLPLSGATDVPVDAMVSWVDIWQCGPDTEGRFELQVDGEVVAEHSFVIGWDEVEVGVRWSPDLQPHTDYELVIWEGAWSQVRSTFRTGEDVAQAVATPPKLDVWDLTLFRHRTGNQTVDVSGQVTSQDRAGGLMHVEVLSDSVEASTVVAPSEDGTFFGFAWPVNDEEEPEEVCIVVRQEDQAGKGLVTSEPVCKAPKIVGPGGCSHVPLGAWAWAGLVSLMLTRRRVRQGR